MLASERREIIPNSNHLKLAPYVFGEQINCVTNQNLRSSGPDSVSHLPISIEGRSFSCHTIGQPLDGRGRKMTTAIATARRSEDGMQAHLVV